MLFTDTLSFDHPRKTADGYMVVRARAARAGIYDYLGSEVDPKGEHGFAANDVVKVYRSDAEVFAQDSVASFLMKPVTNDHPSAPVTADNWRDVAKGVVGKALRDGEYLAFDIVLMDKATIDQVESGKRELSNGYSSIVDFTPGTTEDGKPYDATQSQIRGNHVAVVDCGRAGPMCRIGDAAACARIPADELVAMFTDGRTYSDDENDHKNGSTNVARQSGDNKVATKTIIRDGFSIEVTDQAETYIAKIEGERGQLQDKLTASETKVGELTATVSTKDGEIAALEQKVKDAEVSPAKLEQMAQDRAALIATAKAVDPNVVTDGKSDAEIRKAVVSAKLGDAAKDMDDAAIGGAFRVLTKDVKPTETRDALREVISGQPVNVADAEAEYLKNRDAARNEMSNAWRGKPVANAA